ncbi:hypothetical protein CERSUDRAFT_76344 [Gelatoporia subvermispora B]|uniref:Uncharacterized protein n=1 Tax=Ceriporiopsis subvermispora (strain B) TaxID=914234 RepID=M2Q9R1_CERS8|nr:hypothetical protein CERSUDRAFT_76344 [Gelatoporia subvermispora B]
MTEQIIQGLQQLDVFSGNTLEQQSDLGGVTLSKAEAEGTRIQTHTKMSHDPTGVVVVRSDLLPVELNLPEPVTWEGVHYAQIYGYPVTWDQIKQLAITQLQMKKIDDVVDGQFHYEYGSHVFDHLKKLGIMASVRVALVHREAMETHRRWSENFVFEASNGIAELKTYVLYVCTTDLVSFALRPTAEQMKKLHEFMAPVVKDMPPRWWVINEAM